MFSLVVNGPNKTADVSAETSVSIIVRFRVSVTMMKPATMLSPAMMITIKTMITLMTPLIHLSDESSSSAASKKVGDIDKPVDFNDVDKMFDSESRSDVDEDHRELNEPSFYPFLSVELVNYLDCALISKLTNTTR
jgi:hypothetical protein